MKETTTETTIIWDLPTRLFHWMTVASVTLAWLTTEDSAIRIHLFAGYLVALLLFFRLVWGFIGGFHSRFSNFLYSWEAVKKHLWGILKRERNSYQGHNPAGAWSIFTMLTTLVLVTISGLLTIGGEEGITATASLLTIEEGSWFYELHEGLASLLLCLILVHISGVLVESWVDHENLINAMITGHKTTSPPSAHPKKKSITDKMSVGVLLLIPVIALILTVNAQRMPFSPYPDRQLENHRHYLTWSSECSGCHELLHPSLLPAQSWRTLILQQEDHFGNNLTLDQESTDELIEFLSHYAAEQATTEASTKILRSIQGQPFPIRITNSPYWAKKHHSIEARIWEQSNIGGTVNCSACHLDALTGGYEDHNVDIPPPSKQLNQE